MTEIITQHQEKSSVPVDRATKIGGIVVEEFHEGDKNDGMRRMILDGSHFETNLPEGADIFMESNGTFAVDIEKIDDIPPAEYVLRWHEDDTYTTSGELENLTYLTDQGVATDRAFTKQYEWSAVEPGTSRLLKELGYVLNGDRIKAIPTPNTIVAAASKLGVDVELQPAKGLLSMEDYLAVFARGKYPVATGDMYHYKHDIEDDHLLAVILGGERLRDALATSAMEALESHDKQKIDDCGTYLDLFTAGLREAISPRDIDQEEAESILFKYGAKIGFSRELIQNIFAGALVAAEKFGMIGEAGVEASEPTVQKKSISRIPG